MLVANYSFVLCHQTTKHQALVEARMLQVVGLHLLTMLLLVVDLLNVVATVVAVATSWFHLERYFEALGCAANYLALFLIVEEEEGESRKYLQVR